MINLVIIRTMHINIILILKNRIIIFFNDRFFRSLDRSIFFLIPKNELIILYNHIKI